MHTNAEGWELRKNTLLVFISVLFLSIINIFGQEEAKNTLEEMKGIKVIKNAKKPLSDNSGRSIILKEVLRIEDDGENFFFKLPWGIDVTDEGSVYIQDGD